MIESMKHAAGSVGLICVLGLAGCGTHAQPETPILLAPQQAATQPSFTGDVTLSSPQSELLLSQYLFLTVRFHNAGPARDFYNPGFESIFPPPAALAVYDPKNRYIGNLLPTRQLDTPTPDAWVHIDAGATVEYTFTVSTDTFPGHPGMQLKPGLYTFQLIYSPAYLAPCPEAGILAGSEFDRQLSQHTLMRSNPIKVRLSPLFHQQPEPQLHFQRPL
jgi:hypothetical protein